MKVMYLFDDKIVLENFDEIKTENILTFKILTSGISIALGDKATLPNHYLVSHDNGVIREKVLIDALKKIKYPSKSKFLKVQDVFIRDES